MKPAAADVQELPPHPKTLARAEKRATQRAEMDARLNEKRIAWARGESAKHGEPSDEQLIWAADKAENRLNAKTSRGVAVTIAERRPRYGCTCVHTRKKHKQSGRCRKGCQCTAGARSRA